MLDGIRIVLGVIAIVLSFILFVQGSILMGLVVLILTVVTGLNIRDSIRNRRS